MVRPAHVAFPFAPGLDIDPEIPIRQLLFLITDAEGVIFDASARFKTLVGVQQISHRLGQLSLQVQHMHPHLRPDDLFHGNSNANSVALERTISFDHMRRIFSEEGESFNYHQDLRGSEEYMARVRVIKEHFKLTPQLYVYVMQI